MKRLGRKQIRLENKMSIEGKEKRLSKHNINKNKRNLKWGKEFYKDFLKIYSDHMNFGFCL